MKTWLAIACALCAALLFPAAGDAQGVSTPFGVSPNQMFGCNQSAFYDASASGSTKLVTGNSTQRIYVCGWDLWAGGTANVKLVYGTGGTCGAGTNAITPAFQLTAQTGVVDHLPVYTGTAPVPVSNDLCINTSAGVPVQGVIFYTQF